MDYRKYILTTDLKDEPAVYVLLNIIENKVYVGSTKNIRIRRNAHKSRLQRGVHGNYKLIEAYNKYGWGSFVCGVLKYDVLEEVRKLEQYYLELFDAKNCGYNISCYVDSANDLDIRKKISISNRRNNCNNPNHKLTQDDVEEIIGYLAKGWLPEQLAPKFNVDRCTIKDVKLDRSNYLRSEFPEEYNTIDKFWGCRSITTPEQIKQVLKMKIEHPEMYNFDIAKKMGWPHRSRVDDILALNCNYYKQVFDANRDIRFLYYQISGFLKP